MTAPPTVWDIAWYHGDTNTETFRLTDGTDPVDLTGATAASWAKNGAGPPIVLTVTVGPDPGVVTVAPPAEGIAAGHYRYDLEITDGGQVTTWIQGRLDVAQDITNA